MTLDERNDKVNKALFKKYDEMNAVLEKHEKRLREMKSARDVPVVINSWPDHNPQYGPVGEYQQFLGLIKYDGKWRLCYSNHYESYTGGHPDEDRSPTWQPLVECSVEDRVYAAKHIGKLRDAIVKSKEEFLPKVEEAIADLEQSLTDYEE